VCTCKVKKDGRNEISMVMSTYICTHIMKTFNRKCGSGCPRATHFVLSRVTFE
jgi:hypothetical protein